MQDKSCTSRDAGEASKPLETKTLRKNLLVEVNIVVFLNVQILAFEILSFQIPKGEELKRKWHKILKTKGLLNIKQYHRVCSVKVIYAQYSDNICWQERLW